MSPRVWCAMNPTEGAPFEEDGYKTTILMNLPQTGMWVKKQRKPRQPPKQPDKCRNRPSPISIGNNHQMLTKVRSHL